MTEEVKDRKATKASKATRGVNEKCRGVGTDKKKASSNLTCGFAAFGDEVGSWSNGKINVKGYAREPKVQVGHF